MTTRPQLREIEPISFLFFRTEACLNQLPNFVPVGKDLFEEAVTFNLHVIGPIHWHYVGFRGNPAEPFTLEISLPVAETLSDYDGSFHFKRTDKFRCVTLTHEGTWASMGNSYSKLHEFICSKGLKPLAVNREVYLNTDFQHPDANLTEIQIGVE